MIGAVAQARGFFAAVDLDHQLLHGLLHGVRGDGDAGDGVHGLLLNDLLGPGAADVVGEHVHLALEGRRGDARVGDLAAFDGDAHVDGAEIGGLFNVEFAVYRRSGLIGGRLGFGRRLRFRRGRGLGRGQTRLREDVRGGFLHGVRGVLQRRRGDHVILIGLVGHDGFGPLGAYIVVQQIVVAGRGDGGVEDLVPLYGHGHLNVAVIVAALGGIGAGLLVGHLAAPADAAGEHDAQNQDYRRYHQHGNRLFFHYLSSLPYRPSGGQLAGGGVMTLTGHFWAHLPHWVQLS